MLTFLLICIRLRLQGLAGVLLAQYDSHLAVDGKAPNGRQLGDGEIFKALCNLVENTPWKTFTLHLCSSRLRPSVTRSPMRAGSEQMGQRTSNLPRVSWFSQGAKGSEMRHQVRDTAPVPQIVLTTSQSPETGSDIFAKQVTSGSWI
jgi:hypothetical protein